ncbi:MAG: Spy/CpxP family protein refolding chaperone [Brevinematia bacterium]
MKKTLGILIVILLLLTLQVYSQPKFRTEFPRLKKVIQELDLSDEQRKEIIRILHNSIQEIKNIRTQISKLKKENIEILKSYPPDKEKFLKNQEKISELLGEIYLIRSKDLVKIISILNETQYEKFIQKIYLYE